MTSPAQRQEQIRQLLASGPVRSQRALQAALGERGVEVNQATISRDLAALGVVRGSRGGGPAYLLPDDIADGPALAAAARLRRLLADLPLEIDAAPPLLDPAQRRRVPPTPSPPRWISPATTTWWGPWPATTPSLLPAAAGPVWPASATT